MSLSSSSSWWSSPESSIENISGCPAIDRLISQWRCSLSWISEITDMESVYRFNDEPFYYVANSNRIWSNLVILPLGNRDKCTQEFIHEITRIYSLPTHKHLTQFGKYYKLLEQRNKSIVGFTKH